MTTRSSNLDITQIKKPYIYIGSVEDSTMAADAAIRIQRAIGQEIGLQVGGGTGSGLGPDDSKFNDRPELSDIESITQVIYYDTKQKKKFVTVTVRMRNSSGKKLLGIDVRKTIPAAIGGI